MMARWGGSRLVYNGTYDNLAITQRGIRGSVGIDYPPQNRRPIQWVQDDGSAVTPFPTINCIPPYSNQAAADVRKAYVAARLNVTAFDEAVGVFRSADNPNIQMMVETRLVKARDLAEISPRSRRGTSEMRGLVRACAELSRVRCSLSDTAHFDP